MIGNAEYTGERGRGESCKREGALDGKGLGVGGKELGGLERDGVDLDRVLRAAVAAHGVEVAVRGAVEHGGRVGDERAATTTTTTTTAPTAVEALGPHDLRAARRRGVVVAHARARGRARGRGRRAAVAEEAAVEPAVRAREAQREHRRGQQPGRRQHARTAPRRTAAAGARQRVVHSLTHTFVFFFSPFHVFACLVVSD